METWNTYRAAKENVLLWQIIFRALPLAGGSLLGHERMLLSGVSDATKALRRIIYIVFGHVLPPVGAGGGVKHCWIW